MIFSVFCFVSYFLWFFDDAGSRWYWNLLEKMTDLSKEKTVYLHFSARTMGCKRDRESTEIIHKIKIIIQCNLIVHRIPGEK